MTSYPFQRADELTNSEHLESILGGITSLEIEPLPTGGFSGCGHEAIRAVLLDGSARRFIVKRIPRLTDWTQRLCASARCREAAILIGARMLLRSKSAALDTGNTAAWNEWESRVHRLEEVS